MVCDLPNELKLDICTNGGLHGSMTACMYFPFSVTTYCAACMCIYAGSGGGEQGHGSVESAGILCASALQLHWIKIVPIVFICRLKVFQLIHIHYLDPYNHLPKYAGVILTTSQMER